MNMKELYETNPDLKEYVDKYCISRECSVEVALTHAMVFNYLEYLFEK